MGKNNLIELFETRQGNLDDRVERDYVRNGIVTIPCRITDYSDVISSYSVKGFETLNTDFVDYVKEAAGMTSAGYPIVLDIIGDCLSQEEKQAIEKVIRDDFAYDLGVVEKDENRHTKIFSGMVIGLIISGILLWLTEWLAEEPRELFFILFWFMGDTLCDYIFLTGYDLRRDRRLAGRLASIKVVFSDTYEERNYTDGDVETLYSEIERGVKETMQDEDGDKE